MFKLDEKNMEIQQCIVKMSQRVTNMYHLANKALISGDVDIALKIIKQDQFVNSAEEEINELALNTLALLSPVAKDLRVAITAIKIANELERIGDYAKSIAAYVIKNGKLDDGYAEIATRLCDQVLAMLDNAITAYVKKDVEAAYEIPQEDDTIDAYFKEATKLLKKSIENLENVDLIIPMIAIIRNLERAGDHIVNICEDIIYENKGHLIELG